MKVLVITMPDRSQWAVPVEVIARSRASYYASEFGGDVEASLREDTMPLFDRHPSGIHDWAGNNMDWSDVAAAAFKLRDSEPLRDGEKQEAWVNGPSEIRDITP